MKFTVLGGRGFIGKNIVSALKEYGHEVFVPAKTERLDHTQKFGHIIYAIGITADFRQRSYDTFLAHCSLVNEIVNKCEYDSLVYLSSTRVYKSIPHAKEDSKISIDPNDKDDLYNISKLAGESICLCSKKNNKIVRLSNVVGCNDNSNNFLNSVIRESFSEKLSLRTSLDSEKDYIYISDVVEQIINVTLYGKDKIYNLASGMQISNNVIVSLLNEYINVRVSVVDGSPRVQFPVIDITKLVEEFNFEPMHIESYFPEIIKNIRIKNENHNKYRY